MRLKAIKPFSWAHRGCEVESFEAGQVIETEDRDLIDVATAEGWAAPEGDKKPSENKARKAAPENK
jgi:hypothetical protein